MSTERKPVAFKKFGGLRLDLPLDEIGGEQAQYLRDVDWDGSTGKLRPRDGFQKLGITEADGDYKGLFPHSPLRLLATKRVSPTSVKLVAIDREGVEQKEITWPETPATACFTRFGTPAASYTYGRANLSGAKVVRFDGETFTEPTCSVDGVTGKEMPRGKFMIGWPDGGDRLITANTGPAGGPGGAASSNSHVWFSEPEGKSEAYESTAYVQLEPGDGEEITGLAVFGGQVFVFKETRFFVFYSVDVDEEGRPIFRVREVSLGEGVRMKRPTVEALAESSDQLTCTSSEGVYFCTSEGVFLTGGGPVSKVSEALRPLEEVSPFDGPMADFLNGESETFRWPATGIACIGTRLFVRRYEFMFVLDIPTGEWTCWKMSAVSMAIWTGLTGGGAEVQGKSPATQTQSGGAGLGSWTLEGGGGKASLSFTGLGAPKLSKLLEQEDLGFDIPEGATIVGIQLSMLVRGAVVAKKASLILGGVVQVPNRATGETWPLVPESRNWGGPEDLWDGSPTADLVNEVGLGFAIEVESNTISQLVAHIEAATVTVYYLTSEAASGVRPRLFCAQSKSVLFTAPNATEDVDLLDAEWQSGFYDLGSEDEKALVETKAWGTGTIGLEVFSDFSLAPDAPSSDVLTFLSDPALPPQSIGQARSGKSQRAATLFSHKLSLEPGSRIQRLVRYLEVTLTPTTKSR